MNSGRPREASTTFGGGGSSSGVGLANAGSGTSMMRSATLHPALHVARVAVCKPCTSRTVADEGACQALQCAHCMWCQLLSIARRVPHGLQWK